MNESENNIEIVKTLTDFAVTSRKEGILGFYILVEPEEVKIFDEPENSFCLALIKAMLDGNDLEQLEKIADKLIARQAEVPLSFQIIKKGILLITEGAAPQKVAEELLCLAGDDAFKKYAPCIKEWVENGHKFIEGLYEKQKQKELALITGEVQQRILQADKILLQKEKELSAALNAIRKAGNKNTLSAFINLNDENGEMDFFLTSVQLPSQAEFLEKNDADQIRTPDGILEVTNSTKQLFEVSKCRSEKKDLNYFMNLTENLSQLEKRISFKIENTALL
ncbi:MAG: hypothetical protein ACI4LX_04180 [Treponema sp.]